MFSNENDNFPTPFSERQVALNVIEASRNKKEFLFKFFQDILYLV